MIGKPLSFRTAGALCYAAAAALAIFELVTLALSLRPQVSDAYRAYFITRTSDCWPRLAPPISYEFGNRFAFTSDAHAKALLPPLGCGWGPPEAWGTWTLGPQADLRLSVRPSSSELNLTAMVRPFGRRQQEVQVSVNGTLVATWTMPPGEAREMTAHIPQAAAGDGAMEITFQIRHPTSPRELGISADSRKLGMGVTWLSISPDL